MPLFSAARKNNDRRYGVIVAFDATILQAVDFRRPECRTPFEPSADGLIAVAACTRMRRAARAPHAEAFRQDATPPAPRVLRRSLRVAGRTCHASQKAKSCRQAVRGTTLGLITA